MKATRCSRNIGFALLGLALLAVLFPHSPAWANNNEAEDLAAPYGYMPIVVGDTPGPLTTHYLISNGDTSAATVKVTCYNDVIQRVGPAAGTTITLTAFGMEVWSPVTLGLTTDLNFTGLGFCYFAVTAGGPEIAVAFLVGISDNENLITTNKSLAMMSDTAQGQVGGSDANIPYWTNEGSWETFILPINPTGVGTDLTLNVYTPGGAVLGTWNSPGTPDLEPRDLDFASISGVVPAAAGLYGIADIDTTDSKFMGWMLGWNSWSLQAFMYPVPLDSDSTTSLDSGDRP